MRSWCIDSGLSFNCHWTQATRTLSLSRSNTHSQTIFFPSYLFFILLFPHWPQRDTRQPTSFHLCSFAYAIHVVVVWRRRSPCTQSRIAHTIFSRAHVFVRILFSRSTVQRMIFSFCSLRVSYTFWAGQRPEWMNATRTKVVDATGMCVCAQNFEFKPEIPICSNVGRSGLTATAAAGFFSAHESRIFGFFGAHKFGVCFAMHLVRLRIEFHQHAIKI